MSSIAGSVAEDIFLGIVVGASIKLLGDPQRDNGATGTTARLFVCNLMVFSLAESPRLLSGDSPGKMLRKIHKERASKVLGLRCGDSN